MGYSYDDAALCASVLGALFYFDPLDDKCAPVIAYSLSDDACEQWPQCTSDDESAFILMARNAEQQSETLHESYSRLLVGPNALPAPPWGSVYTDPESVIFGNKTLDVRNWLRKNEVKLNLPYREPEDHFGLMLSMVSWSVANGVSEEELRVFLEQHLLPWTTRFLELFIEGAQGTFYEGVGRLSQATLEKWQQAFELEPQQLKMYR